MFGTEEVWNEREPKEKYSELSCKREMLKISEKWSLTSEFVKQYLTEKQNGYL